MKYGDILNRNMASATGIHTAHLDDSWQTGQAGIQELGCGPHAWAPLLTEHTRLPPTAPNPVLPWFLFLRCILQVTPLEVKCIFGDHTVTSPTVPGGPHLSIAKNVTRDKEAFLEQNLVCVFISWRPLLSSIYGGPGALESEEMKPSQNHQSRGHLWTTSRLTALEDPHFART